MGVFFLLDTPKIEFRMKNLIDSWTKWEHFFQKWGTFFYFRKGQRRPPSLSTASCARQMLKFFIKVLTKQSLIIYVFYWLVVSLIYAILVKRKVTQGKPFLSNFYAMLSVRVQVKTTISSYNLDLKFNFECMKSFLIFQVHSIHLFVNYTQRRI